AILYGFVILFFFLSCHRRSSGRASHAACSPPTYNHVAAPARRVSTIVVACASRVACATAGPLGCPCTPSAVHHRYSSVFSRRVAPTRTTASRLRRTIAPPSHHRAPIAPLCSHRAASRRPVAPLRSHRDAPPARRRWPQNHRNSKTAAATAVSRRSCLLPLPQIHQTLFLKPICLPQPI
ncbi:hypothetical protein U1Q18_002383, partial [Sarracenia purpurea var. burkii]